MSGFVAKYFYFKFSSNERQCFLKSVYKLWTVQQSVVYRGFIWWNQSELRSCVNTLSSPTGELFGIWTKRIGVLTFALDCHETFKFFNLYVC
jgi:hypothetical protein